MDWENIHSSAEYLARMSALNRDEYAVEVIRREVLAKNHRFPLTAGQADVTQCRSRRSHC
jgi:hypothetical protein